MATAELNPAFMNLRGRIGNMVYYNSYGTICVRSRTVPRNPNTPAQQERRRTFAEAVKAWQKLAADEKAFYNKRGRKKRLRGYNLFISEYMKGRSINRSFNDDASLFKAKCRPSSPEMLRSCSVTTPYYEACSVNAALCVPFTSGA